MTTVCVMGMHRSGTSFAARALQLLGVSLGDPEQLMGAGPDNPAGYWENRRLKELDDELLAHLGGSWDQPPVLASGWERAGDLDPLRDRAAVVFEEAFGGALVDETPIGWKDPRLSLLLPFWRTVTPITATVMIVRDPFAVAASLERRNGIGPPQAALLWLRYLLAASAGDPHQLVIDQAAFFEELPATLGRLAGHVGLPAPTPAIEAAVASHLDPDLLHPVTSTEPAEPLTALAAQVWNDGDVTTDGLGRSLADAIAQGWLRPPADGEILARARAKVVKLQATLQRRALQKKVLDAERLALAEDGVRVPPGSES